MGISSSPACTDPSPPSPGRGIIPLAAMPEPYATPRRFPRVKLLGNVTGAISFLQDVTLLDLSEGGARLEHAGRFDLGAICYLRLPAPEGELVLKARVVHSAVSRTVRDPEPTLLFQSGVEFIGLTSEALPGPPAVPRQS